MAGEGGGEVKLLSVVPLLAVPSFSATIPDEPTPDRDEVEESFRQAVIAEYPEADTSLLSVACDIDGSGFGARVGCFGKYLDGTSQVVVTGIAPERDPTDGPPISDPMDWPWEITVVSEDALASDDDADDGSPDFTDLPAQVVSDAFQAVVMWEPLLVDNRDLLVSLAHTAATFCATADEADLSIEALDLLIEVTLEDGSVGEVLRSVVMDTCGDAL